MRTPRTPRIPSRTHAVGVGSVLSMLPMLVMAAVTAIPLFESRPVLSILISVAIAAVIIAAVLRWGYAVYRGFNEPLEPGHPAASPTEPGSDDEDVSEVRAQ